MRSKAPLLLMEQMVMLLVFALAAALCMQAFVQSDAVSRRSEDRDRAVVLCQTAAELVRSGGGIQAAVDRMGLEWVQGSACDLYYDEQWEPLPGSLEGAYCLHLEGDQDPGDTARVLVWVMSERDGTLFYLEVATQWREVNAYG